MIGTTVVIVGAGPVGLVTALRLASHGVPSVVVEADPGLRKQGSKACLIQGDVLEVLDKFGCAGQIAEEGVAWNVARTYVRGKVIRSQEYPRPLGFGPFVNISQYRIEQVLLAAAEAEPRVTLLWSHRLTGVEQDAGGVDARFETPDGEREYRFGYLVACDGVRSTVRELTGVRWTGYTHKDKFLITDIEADLPLAKERHFHYDPPFNPGRQLVMHPQPDDVWRIDWQLAPDADVDAEREDGRLDQRIRAVIGDIPYRIDWLSTYRFHQRVVERMRAGRIFFAGDAAHALPPYGSRGMNSGIQDADNLAWKLAAVLTGEAHEGLLDTYHTERYAAAQENLRVTEATIRFMVPPNRMRQWARRVLLSLASPVRSLRKHVNSGRMAEPYVYTHSPIVQPDPANALTGRFAPDCLVYEGHEPVRLRTLFGDGFVVLCVVDDLSKARRFATAAMAAPVRFVFAVEASEPMPGPTVSGIDSEVYRPGWYLVRPDGHIAAARTAFHVREFRMVLRRCRAATDVQSVQGAA